MGALNRAGTTVSARLGGGKNSASGGSNARYNAIEDDQTHETTTDVERQPPALGGACQRPVVWQFRFR